MRRALLLVLASSTAFADQSLPVPHAGTGGRAVFAVDAGRAVVLACFDGKKLLDRFACMNLVPPDAEVWVEGVGVTRLRGRSVIACGEGEVDPMPRLPPGPSKPGAVPAFVVEGAPRGRIAFAMWHPVELVRAADAYTFSFGGVAVFSREGSDAAQLHVDGKPVGRWGCEPRPTRRPSPGGTSGAAGRARGSSGRARPPSPR